MAIIVDTNVLVVANQGASHASPQCIKSCVSELDAIRKTNVLILDNQWLIIKEYKDNASDSGQPGVGDAFLKWVLTNRTNPKHCQEVPITPLETGGFKEFPQDPTLAKFDPSDHKFVAIACSHPDKPPICNAVDSDWKDFRDALEVAGVTVNFLCPHDLGI